VGGRFAVMENARIKKRPLMKVVRTAKLSFKAGGFDKIYEIFIVDNETSKGGARFLINFRYGRSGGTMREGTRNSTPITRDTAEKLFDSILVAKANEGYRRVDAPAAFQVGQVSKEMPPSPQWRARERDGRARELLARLEACARDPWPEKDRERLFWRVGEARLTDAAPLLLQIAESQGARDAGYSLTWALARCAGGDAADMLRRIAASSANPATRRLAEFASISALMGDRRFDAAPAGTLPGGVAKAAAAADPDALTGALADAAKRAPAQAAQALVELYRLAQQNPALHAALTAAVPRLPARPPYVYGLRKLFKYAEMLDDAPMFGAVAHRFETAQPMYSSGFAYEGRFYLPELGSWTKPDHLAPGKDGKPANVKTALSQATLFYMKRRIWRALRKRAELGQSAFIELATAYLLTFVDTDMVEERRRYVWKRNDPRERFALHTHIYGPFSYAWAMGQLLYRHSPSVRLTPSTLTVVEIAEISPKRRAEAFPLLWDDHPEHAFRLAAESCCQNIAAFGVRVLRANPDFMSCLSTQTLEKLFASPHAVVVRLAFEEARDRLARGDADGDLLAALLESGLPEARRLAVSRINADAALPWTSVRLGVAILTSADDDVATAAAAWCAERRPAAETSAELARRAAEWLLALPGTLDDRTAGRVRHLRKSMALLWPAPDLPLSRDVIERLLGHGSAQVAAAGVEALALAAVEVLSLPDALWQRLLTSPEAEIQAAALGLLNRLSDEQLAERAFLVMALAMAPAAEVRRAARPLATRLAARFERFASDLFRRLIDSLFLSEPAEGYAEDAVALAREALPQQLRSIDPNLLWRLLQAKAKGAKLLGAAAVEGRDPAIFSVRQLARLGNHSHLAVRQWVMAAYGAAPGRFMAEAADAVLLVESDWAETHDFAMNYFRTLPEDAWTPDVLSVITDSVKPGVLDLARDVLRRTLRPADAPAQLARLLEHPAPAMHLLATELLMADGLKDGQAFDRLISFARIVMLQIHKGRVAKDRMSGFLRAEALASRERAERIAPLFADLTLSAVERDRAQAVLALRDIAEAHPGLASPVIRLSVRVA
jgi:hypothetical protein